MRLPAQLSRLPLAALAALTCGSGPLSAFEPGTHGTPFEGRAHLLGCALDGSEGAGCTLAVSGGYASIWADGATEAALLDQLATLPFAQALDVTGDVTGTGDGLSREIVLATATPVADDPVGFVMGLMRGVWEEPSAPGLTIRIDGVDWLEDNPEGEGRSLVLGYGTACPGGEQVEGVVVWMQERTEDGIAEGPCYLAEPTMDGTLTLTSQDNGRSYSYRRLDYIE